MIKQLSLVAFPLALGLSNCEPATPQDLGTGGSQGWGASAGVTQAGSSNGGGPLGGSGPGGSGSTAGGAVGVGGAGPGGSGSTAGGAAGSIGSGGTAGSNAGGAGGGSGGSPSPISDLPVPPGPSVPKPSGAAGGLMVKNWAGFGSAISYTFDDALSSQTANYNALQATGVRMTFYVVSGNGSMSSAWMQAAADGHEIGNHTAHHCQDDGSGCAWGTYAGSLAAEFEQCNTYITGLGVSGVWTSASPYGDTGYGTPAQSLFLINRGVQGGTVAANDNTNAYNLPCHLAASGESASSFNSTIDTARSQGRWQLFLIHSLGGDGGYNPVATNDVVASVNHAKSLGDVWIDSVVNVGAYWRAQKMFSSVTPATSGSDTTWSWTMPAHFPPGKFLRVTVSGGRLLQGGGELTWSEHGYYEVALDAGSLTLSP